MRRHSLHPLAEMIDTQVFLFQSCESKLLQRNQMQSKAHQVLHTLLMVGINPYKELSPKLDYELLFSERHSHLKDVKDLFKSIQSWIALSALYSTDIGLRETGFLR